MIQLVHGDTKVSATEGIIQTIKMVEGENKVVAIVGAAASGPLLPTITNFSPCKTLVRRARNRARAT